PLGPCHRIPEPLGQNNGISTFRSSCRMPPLTFRRNAERWPGYDALGQWASRHLARDHHDSGIEPRRPLPIWPCTLSMTVLDSGSLSLLKMFGGNVTGNRRYRDLLGSWGRWVVPK